MDLIEELLGGEYIVLAPAPRVVAPPGYPDRVEGMLLGLGLGDALGAPHESRRGTPLAAYTGVIEHPLAINRRFQGGHLVGQLGQLSDDSEMTLALGRSMIALPLQPAPLDAEGQSPGYEEGAAIASYLLWANGQPRRGGIEGWGACPFLGHNTRALFRGVRTMAGYRRRMAQARARPVAEWSQSNGCLMRAAPLATLGAGWEAAVRADCAITNPHPACITAELAYVGALRCLLEGGAEDDAAGVALEAAFAYDAVGDVIRDARRRAPRDVVPQKGWALHALYCAFLAPLRNEGPPTFQDRIDAVIRLGGDTDTNAAIAGALQGARVGAAAMRAEERTGRNLAVMLACNPTPLQGVHHYSEGV